MSKSHCVSAPPDYVYLIMDGRAHLDLDRASVMEVLDGPDEEHIWNLFLRDYREAGMDAALVRYTAEGSNLHCPKIIHEWRDLA